MMFQPPSLAPIDEYVVEIDPMEKQWITALIDGDMDAIHHILMSDSNYVNRKGFLNGWVREREKGNKEVWKRGERQTGQEGARRMIEYMYFNYYTDCNALGS